VNLGQSKRDRLFYKNNPDFMRIISIFPKFLKSLANTGQPSAVDRLLHAGSYCRDHLLGLLLSLLLVMTILPLNGLAQADEDRGPMLFSVFPLTGRPGSTIKAELRGVRLDGAYAVWFDHSGFKGRVLNVEEIKDRVKTRFNPLEKLKITGPFYRVFIELQIEPTARVGVYPLRLVSPRGLSNQIGFPVVDVPVIVETQESHQTVEQSQSVVLPGLVNGKIAAPGEIDFYSFPVKKGQEFRFQAIEGQKFGAGAAAGKFAPDLILYRSGGSWFDPNRLSRILSEEELSSDLMQVVLERTYKFPEDGQYFLQVSGLFGQGCPDCVYQVQVFPVERRSGVYARSEKTKTEWSERNLERNLADNWIAQLDARSVKGAEINTPAQSASATQGNHVSSIPDPEPNQTLNLVVPPSPVVVHEATDRDAPARSISLPAIIEGTIEHPGDLDSFTFKVDPGQKLAFEVETPDAKPPYFNPRLGVVDNQNQELFSNVERRLSMFNNNADPQVYLKAVEPKATYTFDHGGEYVLQIRDITSRYGNPSYRYRILVRPEIPHIGEISVMSPPSADAANGELVKGNEINHLNLVRGKARKLILVASYEEGFAGDLSFAFTGMPEGVQAFPAVQSYEDRAPLEVTQNPEIIAPKQKKTVIMVLASPEAPLTNEPRIIQLHCHAIVNGQLGSSLLVREIPLMVVEGLTQKEGEKTQSGK
jgi:hypothetical protein